MVSTMYCPLTNTGNKANPTKIQMKLKSLVPPAGQTLETLEPSGDLSIRAATFTPGNVRSILDCTTILRSSWDFEVLENAPPCRPNQLRKVAMDILRCYQHSWESESNRPELTELLSSLTQELAPGELLALIKYDQEQRWSLGEKRMVEWYCASIPQLGTNREQLVELIANELLCRRRAGEVPRQDEYAQRFPELLASVPMVFQESSMVRPPVAEPMEIEALCDAFEEELSQGRSPDIGQWMLNVAAERRELLFRELLPIELWWLNKRNSVVDQLEYVRRFPEHRSAIEELWIDSNTESTT